jgi:hypothetical protein
MQRLCAALAALGMALLGAPAGAVLIASGDGTGNTSAPVPDPGFSHLGVVNGLSGVYLGEGWVLTANHVGTGSLSLGGVLHAAVPGSTVRLLHSSPSAYTDLRMFRLVTDPGLPSLAVATSPPALDAPAILMGYGRNRGAPVVWNEVAGFAWGAGYTRRWGTNQVSERNLTIGIGDSTVRSFAMDFDDDGGATDEAIAAVGDSGGAVYLGGPGSYQLAGILYAIYGLPGQPSQLALYGGGTLAADLSYYGPQIAALTAQHACGNGVDDDSDGVSDAADPGCLDADDAFETNALVPCDDGFDSDGDGLVDWPDDPGCRDLQWLYENPQCDDGLDNDGDGHVDWDGGPAGGTPDPQCTTAWRNAETPPRACGLGFELAALLPVLARLRRLRRAL